MAGILSDNDLSRIKQDLENSFIALSNGRTVTVVKDSIRTPITPTVISNNNTFGFGERQTDPIYDYSINSASFPCILVFQSKSPSALNTEINARIYAAPASIKIKKDCAQFIKTGQITRTLIIDDKTFYLDGEPTRQTFLSDEYYLLPIKVTK
jgi:hypothetical protein